MHPPQPCLKAGCNRWQQPRLLRLALADLCQDQTFIIAFLHLHLHGCRNLCIPHNLVCKQGATDGSNRASFAWPLQTCARIKLSSSLFCVFTCTVAAICASPTTLFESRVQQMAATAPPSLGPCRPVPRSNFHHASSVSPPARLPQSVHPPQPCLKAGCNRWQQPRLLRLALADLCQDQALITPLPHLHLHGCRNLCIPHNLV